MFKSIGPTELILVLVVVVIFFGVGKLPQVGEALGKGIRSFRKSSQFEDQGTDKEVSIEDTKANTKEAS